MTNKNAGIKNVCHPERSHCHAMTQSKDLLFFTTPGAPCLASEIWVFAASSNGREGSE